MKATRPTLRCLREDLKVPLPPVNRPLDEVAHPLLDKANEHFANESGGRERIRAVDDQLLFKVKSSGGVARCGSSLSCHG